MVSTAIGLRSTERGRVHPGEGRGPPDGAGPPTRDQEDPATEKAETSGGRRKPVGGEVSKCFKKEEEIAHQPKLLGGE